MTPKEEFVCPKCKKKNRIKLPYEVESDKIESIITREIFNHKCKGCGETITLDHNLKITGDNFLVYYTPGSNKEINDSGKEILRVCDTYEDLKEKMLIINDNLFDITVEFIKVYLLKQLDKELLADVTDMRYDGRDEENLIFYLLGANKSIGCSIKFYDLMYKKLKYKKISKCVLIDKDTFDKYYKMRLFR